jgi:agmatine deiminase
MPNLAIANQKCPVDYDFKMPAEWEKHAYTLLVWPICSQWPCPKEAILSTFSKLVHQLLHLQEPVLLLVRPQAREEVTYYLNSPLENLTLLSAEANDSWIRDNGPIFVTRKRTNGTIEMAGIKWAFNGWGEKYPYEKDNLLPYPIFHALNIPYFENKMVLEGGSICVDGEGTLLSTNQCLNAKNRNPNKTPEEIDAILKTYLGVKKVIRLNNGLVGDHTDGHIDNVACFLAPGTVFMQVPSDKQDPNYTLMQENYDILKHATDAKGRKFEIITTPSPHPLDYQDETYCISYVNLYFAGNAVLVPVFGGENTKNDQEALSRLATFFERKREVVPVEGHIFPLGGGNIHCQTQQIPRGTAFNPSHD